MTATPSGSRWLLILTATLKEEEKGGAGSPQKDYFAEERNPRGSEEWDVLFKKYYGDGAAGRMASQRRRMIGNTGDREGRMRLRAHDW